MAQELYFWLGILFFAFAIAAGSILSAVVSGQAPGRRRLHEVTVAGVGGSESLTLALTLDPTLRRLTALMPKSAKDMSRLQRRLAMAGFRGRLTPFWFSLSELLLPVVLGGLALRFIPGPAGWVVAAIVAMVGWATPSLWLGQRVARRKRLIVNGLPDALDLLVVCLEAGSAIDQALVRTSEELTIAYPILADELRLIITETRAGKPRLEAFRNFAQRTNIEEVRALVAILVQTDRFGTSLGQALRTHADSVRTMRRQRAEEAAQKLGVKLVFPLVLCLFPALYVVVLGPPVIKIIRVLLQGAMAAH
jgi:tight adherence protein C